MPACQRKTELLGSVHRVLSEVIELLERQNGALSAGGENSARAISALLDLKFGEQTRALEALHEHRQKHGC